MSKKKKPSAGRKQNRNKVKYVKKVNIEPAKVEVQNIEPKKVNKKVAQFQQLHIGKDESAPKFIENKIKLARKEVEKNTKSFSTFSNELRVAFASSFIKEAEKSKSSLDKLFKNLNIKEAILYDLTEEIYKAGEKLKRLIDNNNNLEEKKAVYNKIQELESSINQIQFDIEIDKFNIFNTVQSIDNYPEINEVAQIESLLESNDKFGITELQEKRLVELKRELGEKDSKLKVLQEKTNKANLDEPQIKSYKSDIEKIETLIKGHTEELKKTYKQKDLIKEKIKEYKGYSTEIETLNKTSLSTPEQKALLQEKLDKQSQVGKEIKKHGKEYFNETSITRLANEEVSKIQKGLYNLSKKDNLTAAEKKAKDELTTKLKSLPAQDKDLINDMNSILDERASYYNKSRSKNTHTDKWEDAYQSAVQNIQVNTNAFAEQNIELNTNDQDISVGNSFYTTDTLNLNKNQNQNKVESNDEQIAESQNQSHDREPIVSDKVTAQEENFGAKTDTFDDNIDNSSDDEQELLDNNPQIDTNYGPTQHTDSQRKEISEKIKGLASTKDKPGVEDLAKKGYLGIGTAMFALVIGFFVIPSLLPMAFSIAILSCGYSFFQLGRARHKINKIAKGKFADGTPYFNREEKSNIRHLLPDAALEYISEAVSTDRRTQKEEPKEQKPVKNEEMESLKAKQQEYDSKIGNLEKENDKLKENYSKIEKEKEEHARIEKEKAEQKAKEEQEKQNQIEEEKMQKKAKELEERRKEEEKQRLIEQKKKEIEKAKEEEQKKKAKEAKQLAQKQNAIKTNDASKPNLDSGISK